MSMYIMTLGRSVYFVKYDVLIVNWNNQQRQWGGVETSTSGHNGHNDSFLPSLGWLCTTEAWILR